MSEAVPTPAELAVWTTVSGLPSARARVRRVARGRARGTFGWIGEPPLLVDVPAGGEMDVLLAAHGRWRLEVDGVLRAVADGRRAAAWYGGELRTGGALLGPAQDLLAPRTRETGGTVAREDLLGRRAWRWEHGPVTRWVDEQTGALLRLDGPDGRVEVTSLEVGGALDDALFEVPGPPPPQAQRQVARPQDPSFSVPWWPDGCLAWPVEGDPDVPEVLLQLGTASGDGWQLAVAPDGVPLRQPRGGPVRRWSGDGWAFALSHPRDVGAEEVDRVVASVPRVWR